MYFRIATLYPKTASAPVFGTLRSEPNSEGMKRCTPAAIAASMKSFWPTNPEFPTAETTASWPLSAAVRDSREV